MDVATDSGLRTLVEWHTAGPRLWADLHRWALRPDLAKAGPWLAAFSRRIKCGECRRHWTQWVNAHPPRLSDAASLFAWTVAAHNAVNRKLGKPEFTLHWATQHWEAVAVTEGPLQTQDEFMFSDVDLKPATGSRRPSPGAVNCHHASPVPRRSNVRCAIGLYGGAPHVSICADCAHRQPRDPSLPAVGDAPLPTPADADLRFEAAEIADPAGSAVASEAPTPRPGQGPAGNVEHLMLRSRLSPGDILMLTAAVRDLHRAYPGRFATSVETSVPALWENNPHVCVADTPAACRTIDMQYPLINQSNQRPVHFLQGYCDYLSSQLGLPLVVSEFRGDVHVSDEERRWTNQVTETFGYAGRFWIIVAGGKFDFTAKWWPPAYYQRVVDHFLGRVQFVQCGERDHWHPPLKGVFNLIGRTSVRQFVRLMYHAEGVICPVTFAMHLAAAVPTKTGRLRPCVVVAGGREPPHWEAYPGHHFLHTVGCLPCCATGGCWKSRCQTLADGDRKDRENLCERPVQVEPDLRVPQCMAMVQPADVIRAVERALSYDP